MTCEQRGKWVRLPVEVRADDDGLRVQGYAAVFNEETDIGGYFREVIQPGAFSDAIGRDEVVFLFNHNSDTVMARTSAGNLKLSEDERGLKIDARLTNDDPDAQKLAAKMRAGNVSKMSFAFMPEVQEWDDSEEVPLRTIKKASLYDVSAVTEPAYDGTEIGLRSLKAFRQDIKEQTRGYAHERIRMKMRLHPAFAQESGNVQSD